MEDESNISPKFKAIIFFVIVAILCVVSYFIYENYFKKVRSISTTSSTVTQAMNLVTSFNALKNVNEIAESFYTDGLVTSDLLSNNTKEWIVYSHLKDKLTSVNYNCNLLKDYSIKTYNTCTTLGIDYTFVNKAQKLSYTDFASEYSKVFGSNATITPDNFSSTGVAAYYSKNNNDFLITTLNGVGGTDETQIVSKLKDATIYEDHLEVEEYYANCTKNTGKSGIECHSGTKVVMSDSTLNSASTLDASSFATLYKFTFKKDTNGNYYWYSSEAIKNN